MLTPMLWAGTQPGERLAGAADLSLTLRSVNFCLNDKTELPARKARLWPPELVDEAGDIASRCPSGATRPSSRRVTSG